MWAPVTYFMELRPSSLLEFEMARTVTIDAFPASAYRHLGRSAIVCVDVLTSTTAAVTAAAPVSSSAACVGRLPARGRGQQS